MKMPQFLKQILTEDDNNSIFCPVRVGGAIALLALVGMAIYHIITNKQFDPASFGTGASTIIGATGLGVGAKAKLGG